MLLKTGLFNHITIEISYGDGCYKVTANRWFFAPFRWKWCICLNEARDVATLWKYNLENSL